MVNKFHAPISAYIHFKKAFSFRPEIVNEIFASIQDTVIIKSLSIPYNTRIENGGFEFNSITAKPVKRHQS
jgi:hypothetical protein